MSSSKVFLGVFLILAAPGAAIADWVQSGKLTANDGDFHDNFGYSVAISGNKAIVGAVLDEDNGPQSGSAYLFDVASGEQLAKLTAQDGATDDRFGWSVGLSGNTAIVGAYGKDDDGTDSGSAYLFDVTSGLQLAKLTAHDAAAEDWFGVSVAISGNTAIVGARWDDDFGNNSGSAYLFDVASGEQLAKLTPVDGEGPDEFGRAVAISGHTAIVGAYLDSDNGLWSGSAYVFVPEPSTWLMLCSLLPALSVARWWRRKHK